MKTVITLFTLSVATLLLYGCGARHAQPTGYQGSPTYSAPANATALVGKWKETVTRDDGTITNTCRYEVKVDAQGVIKIRSLYPGANFSNVRLVGRKLTASAYIPDSGVSYDLNLEWDGGSRMTQTHYAEGSQYNVLWEKE